MATDVADEHHSAVWKSTAEGKFDVISHVYWGARNGADKGLCGDPFPVAEDGRFGRRCGQAGVKTNVDSSALKKVLRELGEVLGQLGQDEWPGVKQDDTDFGRVYAPEAARTSANEVVQSATASTAETRRRRPQT